MTAAFFVLSWAGQGVALWVVQVQDAAEHGQQFSVSDYLWQYAADTLENWQSEALQLVWQAAGLRLLLAWGSSQSREGSDRVEAKLDALCLHAGLNPTAISEDVNRSA